MGEAKMKTGNVVGVDAVVEGMANRVSQWLKEMPAAGVSVAVTYLDPTTGFSTTHLANLNCGPVDLLAIADQLMARASERLAANPDNEDQVDVLRRVERARAALDLAEQDLEGGQ